jgi:hypothetical protein
LSSNYWISPGHSGTGRLLSHFIGVFCRHLRTFWLQNRKPEEGAAKVRSWEAATDGLDKWLANLVREKKMSGRAFKLRMERGFLTLSRFARQRVRE